MRVVVWRRFPQAQATRSAASSVGCSSPRVGLATDAVAVTV